MALDNLVWQPLLRRSAMVLRKAKYFEAASSNDSEPATVARALAELKECCFNSTLAQFSGGYSNQEEWDEFKKREPELAGSIEGLSKLALDVLANAKNSRVVEGWLAPFEAAIETLKADLSDASTRPERISGTRVENVEGRSFIYLAGTDFCFPVETDEAIYFECLLSATLAGNYTSTNDMRKHVSGYFVSHPECILNKLKKKFPFKVIDTSNKGSRIASQYAIFNGNKING